MFFINLDRFILIMKRLDTFIVSLIRLYVFTTNLRHFLNYIQSNLNWVSLSGREPYKETVIKRSWRFISKELYIVYCVIAALGIIFAIFCLVVLIWKRKHRYVVIRGYNV